MRQAIVYAVWFGVRCRVFRGRAHSGSDRVETVQHEGDSIKEETEKARLSQGNARREASREIRSSRRYHAHRK